MLHRVKHHVGNFLPALRYPNYRLYFFGQGISLVGTWMATVAEQWLIYPTLTSNKSLLGIVSAINLLPVTLLVLFAGVWADRVDRRKAQMILQFFYSAIAFIMSYLIFSGRVEVWHVIAASAVTGIVFAFDMPSRQALMVNLVDKQYFASALSLNGAIFNAARVVGSALAGALIAVFAHDIFNRGEIGFGFLQSAFGLGAMIGALGFHALYGSLKQRDRLLIICILGTVVSIGIYALWHQFIPSLTLLFFSGWSIATTIGILNTVVQEAVPDSLRGRILSYYSFVLVGGMPIGAILASIGVATLGAPMTIFLCALAFGLASSAILYSTRRALYHKLATF